MSTNSRLFAANQTQCAFVIFTVQISIYSFMTFQHELRMSYSSSQQQIARQERRAYMWSGELPPRNYSNPVFSCKIFVGGVPWDITESALFEAFNPYGRCKVEWPGNEARFARPGQNGGTITRGKVTGYVYMIFDHEHSVRQLLRDCSQEFGSAGEWYFRLKAKRNNTIETRQVQIIPWVVSDASYVGDPGDRLDGKKTVFVGALHGMITAHVLFSIMNELYGKVVFVGIDTDKYKYPIGSGRVTFSSHSSYFRAIECAFLEIKTSKFRKRIQIDPFLEESECMICHQSIGPYFCRDRGCFRYHCSACWQRRHPPGSVNAAHRYLTRNTPRHNRDPIQVVDHGNSGVPDLTAVSCMGRPRKPQWVKNAISPSNLPSPTRYGFESADYRDNDELVWSKTDTDLTDAKVDVYLQCTQHLPQDTALRILRDMDHDVASAVERCNGVELMPDLSLLEQKVVRATAPCEVPGVASKSKTKFCEDVISSLPHISPPAIRDYFIRLGRDCFCCPGRYCRACDMGWGRDPLDNGGELSPLRNLVQPSLDRLLRAGLISADDDSRLYDKPGDRFTRSSTITPEMLSSAMPRRIGKNNNLTIAMVGYDDSGVRRPKMHVDGPTPNRSRATPLRLNRLPDRAVSIKRESLSPPPIVAPSPVDPPQGVESISPSTGTPPSDGPPKRRRGRPRKIPLIVPGPIPPPPIPSPPSALFPRAASPPLTPSSSSSSTSLNGGRKRVANILDIGMNWNPSDDGWKTRRPSAAMDGKMRREDERNDDSRGQSEPSTSTSRLTGSSRLAAGAEKSETKWSKCFEDCGCRGRLRDSILFSPFPTTDFMTPVSRKTTRSVLTMTTPPSGASNGTTSTTKSPFKKLHIAMVGWHQDPIVEPIAGPIRDRDGFVIPSLSRRSFPSSTRSRRSHSPSPEL